MPSILFWNLANREITYAHIVELSITCSLDLIFLAECPKNVEMLIDLLNSKNNGKYVLTDPQKGKIRGISRLPASDFFLSRINIVGDLSIWNLASYDESIVFVQIAVVHLVSKAGGIDAGGQAVVCSKISDYLQDYEDTEKCYNTLFLGDFNMNPYESGVIGVAGLHGIMARNLVESDRGYRKEKYRKFYNPMWGFFGDRTPGPPGTHFWTSSLPNKHHWYMYDQVLLRPSLIDRLSRLEILDTDGVSSLVNLDGIPTKEHISDHLPVFCVLDV